MTTIELSDDALTVRILGWDKLWALKRRLTIPLEHVRGAEPYTKEAAGKPWLRVPGTYIPKVIRAGTYRQQKAWVFWDVHKPARAIIVRLAHERYAKLVIEVEHPADAIARINEAVSREPSATSRKL